MRADDLVRLWEGQILEEYGVDWNNTLVIVSSSTSDVNFAFSNVDGVRFEWFTPHLR